MIIMIIMIMIIIIAIIHSSSRDPGTARTGNRI